MVTRRISIVLDKHASSQNVLQNEKHIVSGLTLIHTLP